jgi:hypothetical protein
MTNPSPNVWTWARWSPGRSTATADQWRPSLERHVPGSTVPAATQPAAPWATDQPANAVAASTARTVGSAGSVQLTASFDVHAVGSPLATHSAKKPPAVRTTKPGAGSATRRHPQPPVSKSNAAEAEAVGEVSDRLSDRDQGRAAADGKDDCRRYRDGRSASRNAPRGLPVALQRIPLHRLLPHQRHVTGKWPSKAASITSYAVACIAVHQWRSRGRPTGSSVLSAPARCRAGGSRSGPSGSPGRSAP